MGNIKTEFKWFGITQYEKEQEYLRKMHQSGWKLVSISSLGFYHFESCTPEDVVYQLDYNQEGISFKSEYVQMFEDCGWEYLFDFWGYSYFKKPASEMEGQEEIFCDNASRCDMMKRIFKGRMLPLVCVFFCAIIPQLMIQITHYREDESFSAVLLGVFIFLFLLYLFLFLQFAVQYHNFKKKIDGNYSAMH